jgi:hypothetical protein
MTEAESALERFAQRYRLKIRGVRAVEIRGIRPERYSQAIKIAGCRTRPRNRGASPEVMARLRAAKKLNRALEKTPSFAPESRGEAREGVNHYPAQDEAILGAKEALVAVPRAELRPRTHCAAPPPKGCEHAKTFLRPDVPGIIPTGG